MPYTVTFPTALDTLPDPDGSDPMTGSGGYAHDEFHAAANGAIEAIQATVGITNSAVTSTHDYMIRQQALRDLGLPEFPGLEIYASDANNVDMQTGGFYAMLWMPRMARSFSTLLISKANADASESGQMAVYGPVDRPLRGSRIITPATDSPVLVAKSSDTVYPADIGLMEHAASGSVVGDKAYWVVWQHDGGDTAFNATRLLLRALGSASTTPSTSYQQTMFRASSGAPSYGSNFGDVGVATLGGAWQAGHGVSMPILGVA